MILIYEQDLTHYRASFYDFLSKQISEEILILYGKGEPRSSHIFVNEDNSRGFKIKEIERRWIGSSLYYQSLSTVKKLVRENRVSCVIHRGAVRNLSLLRELRFFRNKGIPVILRGIGYSVRRDFNPRRNLLDRLHKFIIDSADAYLCYTEGSKSIMDNFYDPKKIIVAVNTLNSEILISHYNKLVATGKDSIKKELNLTKQRYIIHVGRLAARKKIDKLMDIYANLRAEIADLGLIIVGDGPEKDNLIKYAAAKKLTDVVFTGSLSSESFLTSKYIFASDIVVIPGNLGLAVNHAFLFGKPVVGHVVPKGVKRPKNYLHGPEHEYLINEYNGITVSDDDISSFSKAIIKVLEVPKYSSNALDYAHNNLTVQKMANGYINAINIVRKTDKSN